MTQVVINGLLVGASYALLAIGYTLVFGVMRLLTLAHGQVFMASGAIALIAANAYGLPLVVAGLLAVTIGALLSALTDVVSFRPVGYSRPIAAAVSPSGFAIVIERGIIAIRGDETAVPFLFEVNTDFRVGSVQVSLVEVATFVLALVVMVLTSRFLQRSRWGIAMRAFSRDPEAVALLGVPVRRLAVRTLAVAGGLAGLSAFLWVARNRSVAPSDGFAVGLIALAVMTIGGIGSMRGAVIAGLTLGVVVNVLDYQGLRGWQAAVPWMLLLVVLLLRPQGLFGEADA